MWLLLLFFYTIIVTHSGSYCDGCLVYTKKSTSINRVRCHQQILSYLQHKTSKTQKKHKRQTWEEIQKQNGKKSLKSNKVNREKCLAKTKQVNKSHMKNKFSQLLGRLIIYSFHSLYTHSSISSNFLSQEENNRHHHHHLNQIFPLQ